MACRRCISTPARKPGGRQLSRPTNLYCPGSLGIPKLLASYLLILKFPSQLLMEAIGAIASIIGIAGAGAKLSIVLFEFASAVGSAGQEIRQIGIEISLFCSVLKQLQSTLAKAKAFRYSLSAIETTQEILDRCQEVFKEIEGIINRLRTKGGERYPEAKQDWVARVKWTFKRSQIQLLRGTLESCKVTLHIMLSTLAFAQKIATRRSVHHPSLKCSQLIHS